MYFQTNCFILARPVPMQRKSAGGLRHIAGVGGAETTIRFLVLSAPPPLCYF